MIFDGDEGGDMGGGDAAMPEAPAEGGDMGGGDAAMPEAPAEGGDDSGDGGEGAM